MFSSCFKNISKNPLLTRSVNQTLVNKNCCTCLLFFTTDIHQLLVAPPQIPKVHGFFSTNHAFSLFWCATIERVIAAFFSWEVLLFLPATSMHFKYFEVAFWYILVCWLPYFINSLSPPCFSSQAKTTNQLLTHGVVFPQKRKLRFLNVKSLVNWATCWSKQNHIIITGCAAGLLNSPEMCTCLHTGVIPANTPTTCTLL